MYAVLINVDIKPGRHEESLGYLHEGVVPMSKGAPGFVRGTWFGNEKFGHSLLVFDSEQSARQMAGQVITNAEDPVEVTSTEVYEVHAES